MFSKKHLFVFYIMICISLSGCVFINKEKNSLQGMFYSGKDGTKTLFIDDRGEVLVMLNNTEDDLLLKDVNDGDIIEVKMEVVFASSPGKMPIYGMKIIERGTKEDLPVEAINKYERIVESYKEE